jgi:formylglycine-generating enzyme required for sulfatase activity/lysophospholipase L1-like esterase
MRTNPLISTIVLLLAGLGLAGSVRAADMPTEGEYTNTLGMKFVRIEPGTFQMGQINKTLPWEILPHNSGRGDRVDYLREGDFDERPVHPVKLSQSFYMGVYEVTNLQYELFSPGHKLLRGRNGFSTEDNEAVIFVNWYEARAFCQWLSDKEGLAYRLPTEAEWEYACRAGTATNYYTGDILPKEFYKNNSWELRRPGPKGISLAVGTTPANGWGLYDMHGNVEEWCLDWYGPYKEGLGVDPIGYVDGEFRVTRSGSHDSPVYVLRSANRLGSLPETRNWNIGFRVVLGKPPKTKPLPVPPKPLHQQNIIQRDRKLISQGPPKDKPYFKGPRKFVKIPTEQIGPLFSAHNHGPAIVECPNGDLIVSWFSCVSERNREMAQGGSRLRWAADTWDRASVFFDAPDRNDPTPQLWFDGRNKLYFFIGTSVGGEYKSLAIAMRTSTDSGATWSKARLVMPDFGTTRGGASEPVFRMHDGSIAMVFDDSDSVWFSNDEGLTWFNRGGDIPGIHQGVVQLDDGRLLAYSRGGEIDGMMPKSISNDLAKSFTSVAGEFPHVDGGQRLVLLKLRQGPLFFASFADKGIMITDSSGKQRQVRGLYTAISTDGGETWPHKRIVSDDGPGVAVESTNGGLFLMSQSNAEHKGYMSVCQSLDGLVHLITSMEHYTFNLKWLMTPAPPVRHPRFAVRHVVETFNGSDKFDADGWVPTKCFTGGFNGKGQYLINSLGRENGINRIVGKGSFEATFEVRNLKFNPGNGGVTPGPRIKFKDARTRTLSLRFDKDRIALDVVDEETDSRLNFGKNQEVRYSTVPASAKAKLIWNENKKQWKIFYGFNGDDPTIELPQSKAGIFYGKPFSETTAVSLVVDHGSAEFDNFQIKPVPKQPVAQADPDALRILCFGDSITQGAGAGSQGGYRGQLKNLLDDAGVKTDFVGGANTPGLADPEHEGNGGRRISLLTGRGIREMFKANRNPDMVILLIGINDLIVNRNTVEATIWRMGLLLDQIAQNAPKARILVGNLIPNASDDPVQLYDPAKTYIDSEQKVLQFNKILPRVVESRKAIGINIDWVNLHSRLSREDLCDGIHPNPEGYNKIAQAWFTAIMAGKTNITR